MISSIVRRTALAGLAGVLSAGVAIGPAVATEPPPTPPDRGQPPATSGEAGRAGQIRVEVPPTLGGKWGRYADVPLQSPEPTDDAPAQRSAAAAVDGTVTPLGETGPTGSRLDVVVMGDGYTAEEQDDFATDATGRLEELLELEPYRSYEALANFWMVNAVSADSGVSRDLDANPGNVQDKDTALGSYFWCGGTERLLCIDAPSVDRYAKLAPAADLVIVVANSPRYGGAGYHHGYGGDLGEEYEYSGISTLSSGHWASHLIAAHEIAHSLGGLADEYYYCTEPGYAAYCTWYGFWAGELLWGEVPEPNVTIYGPGAGYGPGYLVEESYKWFRWLGETDPSGGTVGMYDGGRYYASGIYRPTQDSIMKSLANVNFNLPGTEAMVAGFHRYGDLLSSETPSGSTVRRGQRVTVDLADVTGLADPSQVRWYVDGREARQVRGRLSVVPLQLGVSGGGRQQLSVTVQDDTASVRDPEIRDDTRTTLWWTVTR